MLWKSYIDFEIEQEEYENTRNLYKRLLQRTQHVKVEPLSKAASLEENPSPILPVPQVWISYAKFELSVDDPERLQRCRQVFEDANKSLRSCEAKEERLLLLESWRDFEREFGGDATMERVHKLLPEKVKKRRKLTSEDGVRAAACAAEPVQLQQVNAVLWLLQSDAGWEEYYDYIFPEDAANQPNRMLLAMVKLWKKQQMVDTDPETAPEDEEASGSEDQHTVSTETEMETETDTNAAAEQKPEATYDDRDDSGSSSSSDEEGGGEETKQSEDTNKD